MSFWLHVVVFLVSLPLSVLLWAAFLAVFDNDEKIYPLIRFSTVLAAGLVFVTLFGREALASASVALLLVIAFHVSGFYLIRKRYVGLTRAAKNGESFGE